MKLDMDCVVAGSEIPVGATVGPLSDELMFGREVKDENKAQTSIQVSFNNGKFKCTHRPSHKWTSFMWAARDRYEQNMEAYRYHDNQLYIRSIRDIRSGERLRVWYHDSFAIENCIPFLTPANIKGTQEYACTDCGRDFRFPNSLKSHIRFHCAKTVKPSRDGDVFHMPVLNTTPTTSIRAKCILRETVSKADAIRFDEQCFQCDSSNNAHCQPYIQQGDIQYSSIIPRQHPMKYCHVTCGMKSSLSKMFCPYTVKASFSFSPISTGLNDHSLNVHHDVSEQLRCYQENTCAQADFDDEPIDMLHNSFIEMSSSKGNLCIYCGKFYSRKYGLKIHLRTHTGYKPLKCKVCLRPFGDPSNLNKHVRLHSEGDAPYKCKYCGKVLVRKRDLVRHLKSRHPHDSISGIKIDQNVLAEVK